MHSGRYSVFTIIVPLAVRFATIRGVAERGLTGGLDPALLNTAGDDPQKFGLLSIFLAKRIQF